MVCDRLPVMSWYVMVCDHRLASVCDYHPVFVYDHCPVKVCLCVCDHPLVVVCDRHPCPSV